MRDSTCIALGPQFHVGLDDDGGAMFSEKQIHTPGA